MVFAELPVHALGEVVQSPVHAVEEQVYVERIHTGAPQLALHPTSPHVAGVLSFLTVVLHPVLPGVAEVTAQDKLVELGRFVLAEERILQRLRTVLLLEDEPEGVLGVLLCQSSVTAMQTYAAVGAEVVLLGTAEQLHAGRTRPAVAGVVAHGRTGEDIDAAPVGVVLVAEEVVFVGNDAEDGQLLQTVGDLPAQRLVTGHLGIHLIVGWRRAPYLRVVAPFRGVAFGIVRLLQHRTDEDVAGGGDGRADDSLPDLGSPEDGGLREQQRNGVQPAFCRRLAAVGGVPDFCSFFTGNRYRQTASVIEAVGL